MKCKTCNDTGLIKPNTAFEVCPDCQPNFSFIWVACIFALLVILWPNGAKAQNIYVLSDYEDKITYQIVREEVSPERLKFIADSLCNVWDCNSYGVGSKWVEQSYLINANGGYSDASIKEITVYKPQPKIEMLKTYPTGIPFPSTLPPLNSGEVTKDTVTVEVLCKHFKKFQDVTSHWIQIDSIQMERTFEVKTVPIPSPVHHINDAWITDGMSRWETKPIQIESRYLDKTDGCYQLVPLKNE